MPKGNHPHAYFSNPNVDKPLEEIYQDLDSFTDEVFAADTGRHDVLSTFVLLPPLRYRGKFVKGILLSHGVDLLVARNPALKDFFHLLAYSMWSSVPTSEQADALFTLYPNAAREAWFKAKYLHRAHQLWLPFEDADFFDPYRYSPPKEPVRDVDVLCVSRLDAIKNLPTFAQAVKILVEQHRPKPLRCVLVTGKAIDVNWTGLMEGDKEVLRKISAILGPVADYLHIEPAPQANLAEYYGRARCLVLASLIEGKNRTIHEAASCDAPVVTFAQFNQYLRAGHPVLPQGAGEVAPAFTPESLAQTVQKVLAAPEAYAPRQAILAVSGKKHVFNSCIDALPYYREHLPGFEAGHHLDNGWLDLAMWHVHRTTVHQHLFAPHPSMVWIKGLANVEAQLGQICSVVAPAG